MKKHEKHDKKDNQIEELENETAIVWDMSEPDKIATEKQKNMTTSKKIENDNL